MRIAGVGRQGQVSDRMHINPRSNSSGSDRLNSGQQDDSPPQSENSDEEQEIYPEDESEVEEFKVDNSRPSIVPKKRLSEVVEEKKIDQQNRRINADDNGKNERDLEEEWERINQSHNQLAPDSSQQIGGFQQSQISGNNSSCVQDYA